MANRNGSYPVSVHPGIPNLPETPKGWKREPLGKYLKEIKRPLKMVDEESYQLVTVKRNRGGVIEREKLLGKEIKVKSQFLVKAGDFLISKRQIVHGACGVVPENLDGAIVSNEYAVLGTNGGVDLEYLKYLSESIHFQQTCFHSSIGIHVEKMIFKLDRWLEWDFNIPLLTEQQKISQILFTWDRAIKKIHMLIENSQLKKKALMQKLLTGKTRFENFGEPSKNNKLPEDWKIIKLGQHCSKIGSGITPKGGSNNYKTKGIPLIRSQNVFWGTLDFKDIVYIDENQHNSMANSKVMPNDILLNITGASIGRSCVVPKSTVEANVNQHVCIIRTSDFEPKFLCHFLLSDIGQNQINILQAGGNRQGLNFQQIKSFEVPFPSTQEQKRILDFLSKAQDEIVLLNKVLIRLKKEKKSLIQQLLAGKIRVKLDQ